MNHPPDAALPSFAPRGMLMASAFGGAIRRSIGLGLFASAVTGVVVGAAAPGGSLLLTLLVAVVGAVVVGLVVAILSMPRRLRMAFEAYSWLGRREIDRFQSRTASTVPADPVSAATWLAENPRSSSTATARIELLAMLGRFAEAEGEYTVLPSPADDDQRVEQAGLRAFVTFVATGELEQGELEGLEAGLDPRSGVGLEAAAIQALGEARLRRDRDDPTWVEPLIAVRRRLGSDAFAVTVRDTWSRVAVSYAIAGAISGAVVFGVFVILGG